ncbi:MAG: hypothetical protein RLZZ479_897 [Bacteroidota bacterium]|jgi:hypothetical protein
MKSFKEFRNPPKIEQIEIYELDEDQIIEVGNFEKKLNEIVDKEGIPGLEKAISEGIFGAALGYLVGPSIGRVVARALGIEKGILYDMFTSRLVSAALGNAIQNNMNK